MALLRAIRTLISKNLRYLILRRLLLVSITAIIFPITAITIISFGRDLFPTGGARGTGSAHTIKSLADAFDAAASSGRDRLYLVNNGFSGGEIDKLLDRFEEAAVAASSSMQVTRAEDPDVLSKECESSARGYTSCFGAIVMRASPSEGESDWWSYSIHADASLTNSFGASVDSTNGVPQVYFMPIQLALESLIASIDDDEPSPDLFANTQELPFTYDTDEEFKKDGYDTFYSVIAGLLAVVYLVPMVVPAFHLTGFIAGERESGMSQLIDTMSVVERPWASQFARMAANYVSFVIVYAPAWIVTAATMQVGLFNSANFGTLFAIQILGGLSLLSWALLFGSFFTKSQWSGIIAVIMALLWGVLAQMFPKQSTVQVTAFAVLFSPSCYVTFIRILATIEMMDPYPNLHNNIAMPGYWSITPVILFAFFAIQIVGYAGLAFVFERFLHGTESATRKVISGVEAERDLGECAVRLEGFSKIYRPLLPFLGKSKTVVAVDKLDFTAPRGQIVALLGANGSGKSTTLDSIGGLRKLTSGSITIDGTGGLGIAPQRNVLWDSLTVEEHLRIFTQLKTVDPAKLKDKAALDAELNQLLDSIGLLPKRYALAKTLSGGQKRKLQLGMMLTGGSAVCCVDEVSTGIDPLSRRNIWDILLAERGRRTIILTTHFLDEADMLADHIAILSKGTLRAQGSSVELKNALGGGYRVFVPRTSMKPDLPDFEGVERKPAHDSCTYLTPSSELAAVVIKKLEEMSIRDYRVSNPTLEDVFLQLAEEIEDQAAFRATQRLEAAVEEPVSKEKVIDDDVTEEDIDHGPLELNDGTRVGFIHQAQILFVKRILTLKKSWIPVFFALAIPITIAGVITVLQKYMMPLTCAYRAGGTWDREVITTTLNGWGTPFMVGPASSFSEDALSRIVKPMEDAMRSEWDTDEYGGWVGNVELVDSFQEFTDTIETNRTWLSSGIWLGDDTNPPLVAWLASFDAATAMGSLAVLNMLRSNVTIGAAITAFETAEEPYAFYSIQMAIYMTLGLIAYPPLLALYQGSERRNMVRGMEYSNGVKPLALWLAYLSFDFSIVFVISAVAAGIWTASGKVWHEPIWMLGVLFFYGTAAVMLSHLISLGTRSQLATWATAVIFQLVIFGCYFGATFSITESMMPSLIDSTLTTFHFCFALIAPIVSALRSIFVALSMYKLACDGEVEASTPGGMKFYGGPIIYLFVQTIIYGILVVWIDGGFAGASLSRFRKSAGPDAENTASGADADLSSDNYGLQVRNVTKSFGTNTAVDNVTFGIERGEIFALLGPNGAGKSTIVSLIRGDIKPSRATGGDILVEDRSILSDLSGARTKLGVCPQFDALDLLTVKQHLEFYAKIRGVPDYQHNVSAVLRAVGLKPLANRMAHALSGGNKRKLSLGIALMGNPAVVLLDEPSSGLDAASKRIMWQTLLHTSVGRSILLTTHSMEEADALAVRVGIISSRMLAADTPDGLRNRYADMLHVHLVCNSAPRTPPEDMQRLLLWVRETFPNAEVDDKTYHGQIRFAVRGADVLAATSATVTSSEEGTGEGAVGQLIMLLERAKGTQGVAHYSVTPTTLDQVFLSIVRAHSGDEENQHEVALTALGKVGRVFWA